MVDILTDSGWERETILNMCDNEPGVVHVWTAQRRIGVWLESVCKRQGISCTTTGRPTWEASVPSKLIRFMQNASKPRILTDEQRAAIGARLSAARKTKEGRK